MMMIYYLIYYSNIESVWEPRKFRWFCMNDLTQLLIYSFNETILIYFKSVVWFENLKTNYSFRR